LSCLTRHCVNRQWRDSEVNPSSNREPSEICISHIRILYYLYCTFYLLKITVAL
ncbi:hypothetical protein T11_12008, partial [Trichinella zimbabwensis]